jgi:hypothetical protein
MKGASRGALLRCGVSGRAFLKNLGTKADNFLPNESLTVDQDRRQDALDPYFCTSMPLISRGRLQLLPKF